LRTVHDPPRHFRYKRGSTVLMSGLTVYEQVFSAGLLQQINSSIDETRARWWPPDGRHETQVAKSLCDKLRQSVDFQEAESKSRAACKDWAERTFGRSIPENALHTVRCVNRNTPSASYLMHIDRHLLTVLIPLQLAEGADRNGDLVLYKRRDGSLGRRVLARAVLFIQQNLPLVARRIIIRRDLSRGRCVRIQVTPGNVYCFNGALALHANLDVTDGERRSLLVHYYEPWLITVPHGFIRTWRDLRARIAGDRSSESPPCESR
jgi:hypothetical protein